MVIRFVTVDAQYSLPPLVMAKLLASLPSGGGSGSVGPAGPAGPKGDPGAPGPIGLTGAQGQQGVQGVPGPKGDTGSAGAASTVPGPAGPTGATGAAGQSGATGPAGSDGATGAKGDPGTQGPTGLTGATGAQGPQGLQGVQGPKGDTGATGAQGPAGTGSGGGSHYLYFVDAARSGNGTDQNQVIPAGAFTTVTLPTENADPNNVFASNLYTVPATGLYSITAIIRGSDTVGGGRNIAIGVHTNNGDGPWMVWTLTPATVNRHTYPYVRTAVFTAGQVLRLYMYSDGGTFPINSAQLTVTFLGSNA